ncbi:MAG: DUF998 domain-containing protein [Euryarchaeota archaeon]|nr:DUF998 domain-containing protein [Euryarchaeota archaeon]MDE1835627.1 DUF998 domain-containing protein [Euryarchaeota archaeon]MDE1878975.1 DUF998 domain-containing protein [Euryarchaeota archaeon]MDE2043751.1 DUF998 domain-containing protein [Thermoplasmata archaeon]
MGPSVLLVGVVLFAAVLMFEQAIRVGYSTTVGPIAALGVGDPTLASLFNGTLAGLGLTTALFAQGLPGRFRYGRPVVTVLGSDLVLAGVFPEGTEVHWVFGLLLYVLPAIAIWAFFWTFLHDRRRRLTIFTASIIGVASVGLLMTLTGAYGTVGAGGAERLIDYPGLLWGGTLAVVTIRDPSVLGEGRPYRSRGGRGRPHIRESSPELSLTS